MGLDVELVQVDLPVAERCLRDPRLLAYLYHDREWHAGVVQRGGQEHRGDLVEPLPEWIFEAVQEGDRLFFDRAWFQLEEVLTGVDSGGPPPFGNLVWGGREL
jgi:hypothetical protein